MSNARLAARQKRALDWRRSIDQIVQDKGVKQRMQQALQQYQELLAKAWQVGENAEIEAQLADQERMLNGLNEEARLRNVPAKNRCTTSCSH